MEEHGKSTDVHGKRFN